MQCPVCRSELKACEDVFALGKALNVTRTDIPALADKITLKSAIFVNVDLCRNLECRHVSLTYNSTT